MVARKSHGTDFGAIVDAAITDVRSTINGIGQNNHTPYGQGVTDNVISPLVDQLVQSADYAARRVLNGGTIEVTGTTHSSGQDFTVTATGGTFRYAPAVTTDTLTLSGNVNSNIPVAGALTFDAVGNITVGEVIDGSEVVISTMMEPGPMRSSTPSFPRMIASTSAGPPTMIGWCG